MTARLLTTPKVPALRGWVMVTTRPDHSYVRAIGDTFDVSKDECYRKLGLKFACRTKEAGKNLAIGLGYRPIKVRLEPVPQ